MILSSHLETILYLALFLLGSPSGKLVQIEYALQAVAAGAPSVGIKGMQWVGRRKRGYWVGRGEWVEGARKREGVRG